MYLQDILLNFLDKHKIKAQEKHYKKQVPIHELFEDDKKAFRNLPIKPFAARHYDWYKADGYGKICINGKHYYSTSPEYAKQELMVGFYAHIIEVLIHFRNLCRKSYR